jgi:HK97 family phage major capsid protein
MFKQKIQAALAAAEAIRAKGENMTEEDVTAMEAHLAEAEKLKGMQEKLDAQAKRIASFDGQRKVIAQPKAATPVIEVSEPEFTKDPKKGFKTPSEFFSAVMNKNLRGKSDERLSFLATAGSDEQNESSDQYGGFLVPVGFSPNLLQIATEADPTAGRTRIVPMQSKSVEIPARVDENHSTSVAGGITVSRKEETQEGTASRMKFQKVKLDVHTMFGLSYTTEELLSDSPMTVAAILEMGFAEAFKDALLMEKILGTGVGEFEGVTQSPAFIEVAKESAQTADTINLTNILKMRARCWGYANAIWMANHDTYTQLAALNGGTYGTALVWQPSAQEDRPDVLLGRPIFFTEYAATLGDANDIMLINWSEYLEGTYQPMQSAESIHVRFSAHERAFKFWLRNDARGWWKSALTPRRSAVTMSPFIGLAERAGS